MASFPVQRHTAAGGPAECTLRVVPGSSPCDSCGRDEPDDELTAVHRVYVTPEAWDREGKVEVVTEVERWCDVCQSHYPHQPVGATEPEL